MKKGFTLIELLAVIIILSVVAVIATPIILDVVNDARNKANQETVYGIMNAGKYYYAESMLDDTKKYNVENKQDIYSLIQLNGEKPKDGKLYVNDDGQVALSVTIGNKCYVKNFATELQEYEKENEACDLGYVSSDKQAPTVELTLIEGTVGNDNWYTTETYVKINATDSESGFSHYYWCQGKECIPSEDNIETTNGSSKLFVDSNEAQICAIAVDKAGNKSEKKCSDIIKVDTTKPEITGIEDIKINISDELDLITGVEVTDVTSGLEGTFTTDPTTLEITQTGEYEVKYIAKDKAGNEQISTRKVIVSASAPTINFEAEDVINEYGWSNKDFYVTINVVDNTGRGIKEVYVCTSNESDRCEPTDIDSSIKDNKITRLITTESNNNRICVKAIDNANQTSEVVCSDAYKLDKTVPTIGSINVNGELPSEDWYKEDIIITTNDGADSLSGHLETTVDISSIIENTSNKTVTVTTRDKAGNIITKEYTLKLDKTTPSVTIAKSVVNNKNVLTATVTPNTTISGYSYKWYKDGSVVNGETTNTYTPTESGTYKLEVTTVSGIIVTSNEITIDGYTISYNLNGGEGNISSTTKIEDVNANITSTVPTKDGYVFQGWGSSTTDTTVDYLSNASYTANENKTLYAIWKKTVEITFVGNGATVSKATATCDMYNTDTSCKVTFPTITRSGFTITGFNTDSTATTATVASGAEISVSSNVTYYAITSKEVTLTFNRNGATSITPKEGSASTATSLTQKCTIKNSETNCSITSPTITASSNTPTVLGWNTTANSTSSAWAVNTAKTFTENASYYAITRKDAITYNITYSKGTGVSSIGATSGSCNIAETYNGTKQSTTCSTTLPTITASTGYTVSGWYNSSNTKLGNASASISVSASQTITAKATVNSYTCEAGYYLGANAISCTKCEAGSYCPGGTYTFASSTQGKTTCPSGYTNSAAGASAASQCYKTITVSYAGNEATSGSTSDSTCSLYYGSSSCSITLNSNGFSKTNYEFQGWGIDKSNVSYSAGTSQSFSSNTTLYAIWKIIKEPICKRATTLHTETCSANRCKSDGYSSGSTITYGSLGTSGTLKSGDAFDCDVNGDGVYDATTERFYYVSDLYNTSDKTFDNNYAVLIYYNNTYKGVADNSSASGSSWGNGWITDGPIVAKYNLPTTTQWTNVRLLNETRVILSKTNINRSFTFSYSGYAARLLTYYEVTNACNNTSDDECNFLVENTNYSSSAVYSAGHYLETPSDSYNVNYQEGTVYIITGYKSFNTLTNSYYSNSNPVYGVRPVIEVKKTDMSY